MEIPLFVLILQIGFNAALNNRGYNGSPLIPSERVVNSRQTRRLPDSNGYQRLSSRSIIPASDSEQSDDEYSSFEDYSFRSVQPLLSNLNQRRNDYLRYNTGSENEVSHESAPVGRINSYNYADTLQPSSSLSRRTDPNHRRPSNLRQDQTRKYYKRVNDDLSLEVSSSESSNSEEDTSRLVEEVSYLRSQTNNRRGQNHKYYRKANNLSLDVSPINKLDPDEDAVNSLLSFPNRRTKQRNYRKEYNKHQYDIRIREPSPVKDISNAYIATILLITNDKKPDEIPIGRPKLGRPESTGLGNKNLYNRHGDKLNLDYDISNNLSTFGRLKPQLRSRKLKNVSPLTRKFNNYSLSGDDNAGLESSLNDELFTDGDKTGNFTLLSLANLEDLHLNSPLLRSGDLKNHNNRKSNRRNLLRLLLSPNKKLTLDEGTLDELNFIPVTLRRTGPSNNKYSRRKNNRLSAEEDNLSNLPVLRLGSVDIPNAELLLRRYHEFVNRSYNRNLRKHGNNRQVLKKLFHDSLVPHHKVKSNKLRINEKVNNYRRNDFSDEFSLESFFKEDHDDILDPDKKFSSDLSVLLSTNQDQLSFEPPVLRSSDENSSKSKDTDDTLHLEFPWNDQLSPRKDKTSNLLTLRKLKSQLRSPEENDITKDTTDTLHFEFPSNDHLSFDNDNSSKLSGVPGLRSKSKNSKEKDNATDTADTLHLEFPWNDRLSTENDKTSNLSSLRELKSDLRSPEQKDNTEETSNTLHLKFPWNDQLSSNIDKGKLHLRSNKQKDNAEDSTDTLHLEFPWNDALSPNENKTGELRSQSFLNSQSDSRQDKEPKDELKLEFPWNDKPSPDKPSNKKTTVRTPDPLYVHPYLRNRKYKNIQKHPNYFKRSYDEFTEGIRLEKLKDLSESHLRHSNRRFNDNQSLGVLPLTREDFENDTVFKDTDEDPSTVITFPDRTPDRLMTPAAGTPSLLTTTERSNDTELNFIGDKNDRITYNDTIIFPLSS